MQGLGEALAHAKGEAVPGLVLHIPAQVDVSAIHGPRPRTARHAGAQSEDC